jgi:high-affinity nickel-transport protein
VITPLSVVALGFVLGMRHATDADHVMAVMTIVSRQRSLKPAACVGALWGVGHTLTVVLVGSVIILFNLAIPDHLGLAMELGVGLMLIVLGLTTVAGSARAVSAPDGPRSAPAVVHTHPHSHGDYVHTHPHGHEPERHPHAPDDTPLARLDRLFGRLGAYQALRPLVVGIVHGLAGSAAVVLLVLAAIRDAQWAIAYLLVFGLGTITGMVLLTTIVAVPFVYTSRQFLVLNRRAQLATGLLSVALGVLLSYRLVLRS